MRNKHEIIIASLSVLIAVFALFAAIWSGIETRSHNRLSVRPSLNFDIDFTNNQEYAGLLLSNKGLGPAVIKEFSVFLDSSKMPDLGFSGIKTAISNLDIDEPWIDIISLGDQDVLRSTETIPILTISKENTNENRVIILRRILGRISIKIKYESMYKEPDEVEFKGIK